MQDYNTLFSHSVLDFMKNHDWEHILPEGIQSDFVAIFLYISGIHNFPRLGTFFYLNLLLHSMCEYWPRDLRLLLILQQFIEPPGTAPKLSNPNRTARWAWGMLGSSCNGKLLHKYILY